MPRASSAQAKIERDREIVNDRARGYTWRTIAARHGLSVTAAQKVWREGLDRSWEDLADPVEQAAELLALYDSAIEDYAELAATTRNDSVKLGAMKARVETQVAKVELMRAFGLLPRDIRWLRTEIDIEAIADNASSVFSRYDVPDEMIEEYVAALQSGVRQRSTNLKFERRGVGKTPAKRTRALSNGAG